MRRRRYAVLAALVLTRRDAQAIAARLVRNAHSHGLAVAQKNWSDRIAVVRRDADLTQDGVRRWCAA